MTRKILDRERASRLVDDLDQKFAAIGKMKDGLGLVLFGEEPRPVRLYINPTAKDPFVLEGPETEELTAQTGLTF